MRLKSKFGFSGGPVNNVHKDDYIWPKHLRWTAHFYTWLPILLQLGGGVIWCRVLRQPPLIGYCLMILAFWISVRLGLRRRSLEWGADTRRLSYWVYMCPLTCEFFKNPDLVYKSQFSNVKKKRGFKQHVPKITQLFGYMSVHKTKSVLRQKKKN
jgi:hypothetical protein